MIFAILIPSVVMMTGGTVSLPSQATLTSLSGSFTIYMCIRTSHVLLPYVVLIYHDLVSCTSIFKRDLLDADMDMITLKPKVAAK